MALILRPLVAKNTQNTRILGCRNERFKRVNALLVTHSALHEVSRFQQQVVWFCYNFCYQFMEYLLIYTLPICGINTFPLVLLPMEMDGVPRGQTVSPFLHFCGAAENHVDSKYFVKLKRESCNKTFSYISWQRKYSGDRVNEAATTYKRISKAVTIVSIRGSPSCLNYQTDLHAARLTRETERECTCALCIPQPEHKGLTSSDVIPAEVVP